MGPSKIALLVGLGIASGCAMSAAPQPITYEEFVAQAAFDPDNGTYVVSGDEMVENEAELHQLYDGYLESFADLQAAEAGYGVSRQGLIVWTVNGADDKWSDAKATHLTYCISKASFGAQYDLMVSAMHDATTQWERIANVGFTRLIAKDDDCTNATTGVVFNVRQVSGKTYLARSFHPSVSRKNREILVDTQSFGVIEPFTIRGVLRHELGHTLGFRHEHTRPESGTCFEGDTWRALTVYDSASVMHYPQCNGSNTGNLRLTQLDIDGASSLYPFTPLSQ